MREMGKAMMGTGEASGDKRAIEAAEKAISNPLLDDVCMRGAKGLLISITGGRDMTLFEVDEAASRVREEVEPEANIIFGATFDEGLEGIIRVSVVATGIEQERVQEQVAPPTAGMAELTRRLKSVAQPGPAQAASHQAGQAAHAAAHQPQREAVPAYALEGLEQELSIPLAQTRGQPSPGGQARPAAQARPAGDPSVRIGPFRPDPSLMPKHDDAEAEHARANEAAARAIASPHFIPPAAERPEEVQARMPRVEDFPAVAQRQIKAQQAPAPAADDERRPRGLLARLTSGLTRRDEEEGEAPAPARTSRQSSEEPRVVAASAPAAHPANTPASEFKPQPRRMGEGGGAAGNLDQRGRAAPVEQGRDELEIPAFLRRQTN
jgi:cell division protein FtsZ